MNKSELVNAIAAGANLSKADAKKALDVTLNAISDALKLSLIHISEPTRLL